MKLNSDEGQTFPEEMTIDVSQESKKKKSGFWMVFNNSNEIMIN